MNKSDKIKEAIVNAGDGDFSIPPSITSENFVMASAGASNLMNFMEAKVELGELPLENALTLVEIEQLVIEYASVLGQMRDNQVEMTASTIRDWIQYDREYKKWLETSHESQMAEVRSKPNKPHHYQDKK